MQRYYSLFNSVGAKIPSDISPQISLFTSSELILATTIVACMHHVSFACGSIILHKVDVHGAAEMDSIMRNIGLSVVRLTTPIIPKEWRAAHKQHHRKSDIIWDSDSKTLGDPHTPQLLGNNKLFRLIKQFFSLRKEYTEAINALYDNTEKRRNHQRSDKLFSTVDLEGPKPGIVERYGPMASLFGMYIAIFGPSTGFGMLVSHGILGSLALTITNGAGHGAEERSEGTGGDHSINLAGDNEKISGRMWNSFLAFLTCSDGGLHGNHHKVMVSADTTLGDPEQYDIGYYYMRKLEEFGLMWNIKISTMHAKK